MLRTCFWTGRRKSTTKSFMDSPQKIQSLEFIMTFKIRKKKKKPYRALVVLTSFSGDEMDSLKECCTRMKKNQKHIYFLSKVNPSTK